MKSKKEKFEKSQTTFRLLNIMVEKLMPDNVAFSPIVSAALREYADAIDVEKAGCRAIEEFRTSNECTIRMIHGYRSPVVSQEDSLFSWFHFWLFWYESLK